MVKCSLCKNEGKLKYDKYTICNSCKTRLGLFTDETIKKYMKRFGKDEYLKEMNSRLVKLDEDYIKKKIKLTHMKERINNI